MTGLPFYPLSLHQKLNRHLPHPPFQIQNQIRSFTLNLFPSVYHCKTWTKYWFKCSLLTCRQQQGMVIVDAVESWVFLISDLFGNESRDVLQTLRHFICVVVQNGVHEFWRFIISVWKYVMSCHGQGTWCWNVNVFILWANFWIELLSKLPLFCQCNFISNDATTWLSMGSKDTPSQSLCHLITYWTCLKMFPSNKLIVRTTKDGLSTKTLNWGIETNRWINDTVAFIFL